MRSYVLFKKIPYSFNKFFKADFHVGICKKKLYLAFNKKENLRLALVKSCLVPSTLGFVFY